MTTADIPHPLLSSIDKEYSSMRRRPSARVLLLDPRERVLLFRFAFTEGALAGQTYWGTPGGALEDGETFEEGARRELAEETGIEVDDVGASIARREFVLPMPDGEKVLAEELYFLVRCRDAAISGERWTALERVVMVEHRWWSLDDLSATKETVYPEGLVEMLRTAGIVTTGCAQTPLLPLRLGFLASHGGSGMKAVVQASVAGRLNASACLLISNNSDCEAMTWAREQAIEYRHFSSRTHASPPDLDLAIADALTGADVSLIVLSGYMRKLGPETVRRYRARILNVHPALLPKHGGQGMYGDRVHAKVLASGDQLTGATVHLVDEEYDHGPAISQRTVPVLKDDTVESLGARVRAEEQRLLVATLCDIANGAINLDRASG